MKLHASHLAALRGNALLISLGMMTIVAAFVAAALTMTTEGNRMARRERDIAMLEAAADGATEYYYAVWKKWIASNNFNAPTSTDLATFAVPSVSLNPEFGAKGVTFSNRRVEFADPWGNALNSTAETTVRNNGGFKEFNLKNYPGWAGSSYHYRVSVKASGPRTPGMSRVPEVAVRRYFQIANVPLFQAAIFFEEDLELHPGDDMTINGKVHTNQDAWVIGYQKLQFLDRLSYSGNYTEGVSPERAGLFATDPNQPPWWKDNQQSATSTMKASQLSKVERIEPFGTGPAEVFNKADNNPNNDSFHELIEPPVSGYTDPPAIAQRRLYNNADIKITIDSSKSSSDSSRVTVTYKTGGAANALKANTVTAFKNAVSSTSTNLYDRREQANLKTTNVDVALLNTAITELQRTTGSNPEGKTFNGVVYVTDIATGRNAIRVANGAELVQDLTIASDDPIYLQGDFNTGGGIGASHNVNAIPSNNDGNPTGTDATYANGYNRKSAAIVGDVVTILSNSWNDTNASKDISSRTASHTTINAAILSGYLPTDYNNNNAAGGGAHNLPRFLENWSGKDFSYLGSMVQIYVTEKMTGLWYTGQIYSPPARRWGYDTQFNTRQPPGFLQGTIYSRGRWERVAAGDLTGGT